MCGIGLVEQVKGDFGLGKEFVPKVERETIDDPGKYAEEVRFEVANRHFGCVVAMAAGWDKFECLLVCVLD